MTSTNDTTDPAPPLGATARADDDRITGAVLKIAGVVVLGAIMSILDITVVNVALPTFQTVFGTPATDRLLHRRLDGDGLHAGAGHGHPDDRLGRRPVRHQAALHDRDRAVRRSGSVLCATRVEHRRR